MNDNLLGRVKNARRLLKNRRIKTQKQELDFNQQASKTIEKKCEPFLQALKKIHDKVQKKPFVINISIPLRSNKSSLSKIETPQVRLVKQKDFFVTKMRRKQQTRSKLLLQRLETQNKSMSLLQLCQKWKQTVQLHQNARDRSQAIKQMKIKVRQRSQFSFSENKTRNQLQAKNSRVNIL